MNVLPNTYERSSAQQVSQKEFYKSRLDHFHCFFPRKYSKFETKDLGCNVVK